MILLKIQCPSGNQPTQCHEARRGKCQMGGAGFSTGAIGYSYIYMSYKNEILKKKAHSAIYADIKKSFFSHSLHASQEWITTLLAA